MSESPNKTHFGFQEVDENQKQNLVADVFKSVAGNYDVMNDAMSMGLHRAWKWFTIAQSGVNPGNEVLDLAAGSGDLSLKFAAKVGPQGRVVVTDINPAMLAQGRRRLTDAGIAGNIDYCLVNAEQLPFDDNQFDCISISFGLRNVTHKDVALREMQRCLKPGGRVLVLEFSQPTNPTFSRLYDAYSFNVIPKLGELISNDRDSYQYLVESIRRHPGQEELKQMMLEAGFDRVRYHNLTGGIVALHVGYKY
ncbi:ubiquinone/menaquinone biosynthesis C-methyltransferase UbiE [Arenicella chitinivorans]|uniref:Ubiquinone/menaquinone biosynthesis C-methyltransferase UbiE n=1 Tax=Arenicella chitinivorans TaxID=1329800 RepID=A0A918S0D7_9GAMM|nr:bifunctional demethylmenaquinone methyltransferase/2-methoxy-6-polyprenyl-1,4-benzoquinol methylase UbiE [Arenicella chitinivorans]GHA18487.1 ubiquinone/menaquinone biosynthesis C-methyltransferase UbiE [Arenicella chitinivorans]